MRGRDLAWAAAGAAIGVGAVLAWRSRRPRPLAAGAFPRVVIVGGGFAGLEAARALDGAPVRVTLVDRRNHHLFQPLLYQVATAALNPADISAPIRHVLRHQQNAEVVLGRVTGIEADARRVRLADGTAVPYDFLLLATGATHSYLGHDEWAPLAPGLKTVEDALEIRRRILLAFERAEREADPAVRAALLTFVIVGGGPTGVELAGALAEIARHTLLADFRHIAPESARIVLVEALPEVLPAYSPRLRAAARRQLERLGVEVRTGAGVTGIDADGVSIGRERLAARTVLWGAGVSASALAQSIAAPLDRAGRVKVLPDLTVPGHPEISVAGDLAAVASGGTPVPGVAPAAIQEGRHAAANVLRTLAGYRRRPFRYRDKGLLATIGRAAGVARLGRLEFSGLPAWLAWLLVHIFFLIGFRNRVAVMLEWAWSYATFKRGARLITDTAEQVRFVATRNAPAPPDVRAGEEPATP
jgi:NADH:quinone reductase (non-electrogenic)